jgi:hypothetical protein
MLSLHSQLLHYTAHETVPATARSLSLPFKRNVFEKRKTVEDRFVLLERLGTKRNALILFEIFSKDLVHEIRFISIAQLTVVMVTGSNA